MANLDALLEAERRGILPEAKQAALAEARNRGLVPSATPYAPIPAPVAGPPTPDGGMMAGLSAAGRAADDLARSTASGLTFGAADKIAAGADALLGEGTYEENLAQERARTKEISPFVSIPAETAGMVATGALGAPVMAATKLPIAAQALLGGTGGGALYGYNVAEEGEEARNAMIGGGAGLLGALGGQALSRLISPAASRNPAVQTLMEEGVSPTPGQTVGGTARAIEEKAISVPFLGDAIKRGQTRAIEQFNNATINKAMRPLGVKVQGFGREAVNQAEDILTATYDDVLSGMNATLDQGFVDDLTRIAAKAGDELPADLMGVFQNRIKRLGTLASMKGGTLTGREAKTTISELGQDMMDYIRSGNPRDRNLGRIYGEVKDAFSDLLQRSSPPDKATKLRSADQAWSNFLRLGETAGKIGAKEGVFTPAQLLSGIRGADKTLRKGAFRRGEAPLQDLAQAADSVLSSKIPNSGTTDRGLLALLAAAGGGGMVADPLTTAAIAGGVMAPSVAYTPLLQRLLARGLASRPAGAPAVARAAEGLGLGAGLGAASFLAGP